MINLTVSFRNSVVDPGWWTLSIETIIVFDPWFEGKNATSRALPFNGSGAPKVALVPKLKWNSAGSPSQATSISSI